MIWYASTALWTGVLALFTAVMAGVTYWSIVASQRQQRSAWQQSEQHHQDSFRPVLVLEPSDAELPIPLDRSRLLQLAPVDSGSTVRTYVIACRLSNIGVGPALNVHLRLRVRGIEGYGISCEIPSLGTDFTGIRDDNGQLRVPFRLGDGFNDAGVQLSTGDPWDLMLEYEDVFGNRFHTIHSKNPQAPWMQCGKGPAPQGQDPRVFNEELRAKTRAHAALADVPYSPNEP